MELSVSDPEEKMLNANVNKLIGDDTNLATIVKMALKPDCVDDETKDKLLYTIRVANEKEAKYYQEQFKLTMDFAGNIVEVNNIDERLTEIKADTGSELPEPEGSIEEI
jgi:hypothetical protein